ncbi:hypothetical protein BD311DRAFT_599063, partial [Dichomitus squalens]
LDDDDLVHRTRLSEQILVHYRQEYQKIISELQHAPGRVSYTLDLWEDEDRQTFMGLTAHHCHED